LSRIVFESGVLQKVVKLDARRSGTERTYRFDVEKLLYEGYAVGGSLAAPCASTGEDIAVFEREGNSLLLDKCGTRKTKICERTEYERGQEMRKRGKCLELVILSHFALRPIQSQFPENKMNWP
jgi:hypothetical protein